MVNMGDTGDMGSYSGDIARLGKSIASLRVASLRVALKVCSSRMSCTARAKLFAYGMRFSRSTTASALMGTPSL